MPCTITVFFPDGKTEYWLTEATFEVGEELDKHGQRWVVTSVGKKDGTQQQVSVTLQRGGAADDA